MYHCKSPIIQEGTEMEWHITHVYKLLTHDDYVSLSMKHMNAVSQSTKYLVATSINVGQRISTETIYVCVYVCLAGNRKQLQNKDK